MAGISSKIPAFLYNIVFTQPDMTSNLSNIHKLILASGSPYRRELLSRLHIPFEVKPADIDESQKTGETARELALRLAEEKASAIATYMPDAWVIGSDQTLALDTGNAEEILGKPGNHENAVTQLLKLSGQEVHFYSSLCLMAADKFKETGLCEIAVRFRELTLEEIEHYLGLEPAYDCAGSCKAEGLGITLVEYIRSDDPTALIGLPLIQLRQMLAKAGLDLPSLHESG